MPSLTKELMIKEMNAEFETNPYAFISSVSDLPVAEVSELRRNLEKVSKRSMMVKHTLAKKVFESKEYDEADKLLSGSVLVTFADKDPQATSKALADFAKANDKLAPSGVIFEGKVYEKAFVMKLAKLPSREELVTQMLVRMNSPISGLVMTLGQVMRGLVTALDAVKQKKEAGPQTA